MKTNELTFEEIFDQDGLYVSDSFSEGVAFKILFETLSMVTYKSKDDLLPFEEHIPVYLGLFKKKYKEVLTTKTLFKDE
jgi:hypothetical protein